MGRVEIHKPAALTAAIAKDSEAGGKIQLETGIFPEGKGLSTDRIFSLLLEETGGEWLGMDLVPDPSQHDRRRPDLAGRAEALEDLQQQYETVRSKALAEIRSAGCDVTKERLAEIVKGMALLAARKGADTYLIDDEIEQAAKVACDNRRTGLLPDFEVWLLLVLSEDVDPCEPTGGLPVEAAQKARNELSRAEYDRFALEMAFRIFMREHPGTEECVLDRIEERILGKGKFAH